MRPEARGSTTLHQWLGTSRARRANQRGVASEHFGLIAKRPGKRISTSESLLGAPRNTERPTSGSLPAARSDNCKRHTLPFQRFSIASASFGNTKKDSPESADKISESPKQITSADFRLTDRFLNIACLLRECFATLSTTRCK